MSYSYFPGRFKIPHFYRLFNLCSIIAVLICWVFWISNVFAVDVTLGWDANSESYLAGYKIYYKTAFFGPPYDGIGADEGNSPITLPLEELHSPEDPEYTIHGLHDGKTYFFAVTAYSTSGLESIYSNEIYILCSHIAPPEVNAAFTAFPTSGYSPLMVDFSDQSSGAINSRIWDFGDGGTSTGQDTTHEYHEVGSYPVRLIVMGPDGCDDEIKPDFITIVDFLAGVEELETGQYVSTGKGKSMTTSYVITDTFNTGDEVIIQAYVVDIITGLPLENAMVEISISGPENFNITSYLSNSAGIAEAIWHTITPKNKNRSGTTPGLYEATVTNVVADGYVWDENDSRKDFIIQ